MRLKSVRKDIKEYLVVHKLEKKWDKASRLFESSIRHPSLEVELLEPHWRGIYSFRIDKKYRALFFIENDATEVFKITNHYK